MVLSHTFKDLLAATGINVTKSRALLGLTGAALLPLCPVKNLSLLAPFSLLGTSGMTCTAIAVVTRFFDGSHATPGGRFLADLPTTVQPAFGSTGATGALSPNSLILICMLSTAYIAHFNAPNFFRELKNNTLSCFNRVVSASFGTSMAMYALVTSMGFSTFGSATQGLTLNDCATNDALISFSQFAMALSLVFSCPLLFVGTCDGFLDLSNVPEKRRTDSLLRNLSVGLVSFVAALAPNVQDLTFVASMSGAVFGTSLIFIFPALMFRAAVTSMGENATNRQRWESRLCGAIAVLGAAIGRVGAKMVLNNANLH